MKIAIFPCNNGLGHIKRSFELAEKISIKNEVDFFIKKIPRNKFKKKKNLSIKQINSPANLDNFKKPTYPNWICNLDLSKYDKIYSDTLPEIVLLKNTSIIFANFFWNKIYKMNNSIFRKIDNKLKSCKIYTNYLFFHKPSLKNTKIIKVGFFGKFLKKTYKENNNVLISLGTAKLVGSKKLIQEIKKIVNKNKNFNFYIDKKYFKILKKLKNVFVAKHNKKMFQKVSIAIIKPGFSIISECFKNGIPIFCFDNKQNNEFSHNSFILTKYKLGFKNNNIKQLFLNALSSKKATKIKLFNRYKNLRWNGDLKILNEIKK